MNEKAFRNVGIEIQKKGGSAVVCWSPYSLMRSTYPLDILTF